MRSLQLRCRPATNIAQSKRHAGRSADAGMAVDNDSPCIGPRIDELQNSAYVILGKENIRRIFRFEDIGEVQSQNRREVAGDIGRIHIGVSDGDADFLLARLVLLGVLSRQDDKLRNLVLSPCHGSPTLPPLRCDGQVAHDYAR